MDQVKIGKFIAECRKQANLTQMQLAEKLNITDRAVSKWETGKAMPDSSIMLELCDALKITVNDLLSGEVVSMENFIKIYWKTLLFFAMIGLLGGFFTGIYVLDSYPADIKQQLLEELNGSGLGQVSADILMGIITAIQSAGYGIVLGAIGIWLGKKIGTWKDERVITKKPLAISLVVSVVGGLAMILPDMLFFGHHSEAIMNSYAAKPTIPYLLATMTYGAVIEEVMLRLFWMSLIAFVLHKLFEKKHDKPTVAILIIANVIAALLFAAGHLPATAQLMGLTPMIIVRCFLLNGGLGLLFGWLYRKYGLRYSMIAHGGCHIVSKLIWILFI